MEVRDRIVVIEDDRSIINLLKTILKANNYDVLVTASGAEALTVISSHCPDLVIPGKQFFVKPEKLRIQVIRIRMHFQP